MAGSKNARLLGWGMQGTDVKCIFWTQGKRRLRGLKCRILEPKALTNPPQKINLQVQAQEMRKKSRQRLTCSFQGIAGPRSWGHGGFQSSGVASLLPDGGGPGPKYM